MRTFSSAQQMRLWMIYLGAAPLAFLLGPLIMVGQYEGWIGVIAGASISLIFVYYSWRLGTSFPQEEWGNYGNRILGSWVHALFLLMLLIYCLIVAALSVASYTDLFSSVYLPGTPDTMIIGIYLICACLVARSGIRSIVFMADGFFILVSSAALFVIPFIFSNVRFNMLHALINHWNQAQMMQSTFFSEGWMGELTLLFLLYPFFKTEGKMMRRFIIVQFAISLFVLSYWLLTMLLFGPQLASHMRFPLVEVIRFVSFGDVIENLDPILIGVWSATLLMKSAILIFIAARLLSQLLRLDSESSLSFAIGTLVFMSAYQFIQHPTSFNNILMSGPFNAFAHLIQVIPLLYWMVAKLRNQRGH